MKRTILIFILVLIYSVANASIWADFLNQSQIDDLANKSYQYLRSRTERGSTVVILNKNNRYERHTNSIIRGIQRNAVNDNFFTVVSRDNNIQALITAERNFQDSGFVSMRDRVSVTEQLGATHLFAVEIIRERGYTFLYVYGINQETGILEGYERFEPRGEMLNAYDINGFVGITAPFMIGGSEQESLGSLGTTIGGTAGASMTIFPEALGLPRIFIPTEIGFMITQRGFKSENTDDTQTVNYTDVFLKVYPLNRTMGSISGFNPVLGVAYSMSSKQPFKDDFTILATLSFRSRGSGFRFGVDLGVDIGTLEVFYDYKVITPRAVVNLGFL